MQRVILSFCLILVSVQATAQGAGVAMPFYVEQSRSPLEVKQLVAIAEAKYKIGNAQRIIEKAQIEKKEVQEAIIKAEEGIKNWNLNKEQAQVDKEAAEIVKIKAQTEIVAAEAAIQKALAEMETAEEIMRQEGININTETEAIQKATANSDTLITKQLVAERELVAAEIDKRNAEARRANAATWVISAQCSPPPVLISLYEASSNSFFHHLDCDEDILARVCNDIAAKSRPELESILNRRMPHPGYHQLAKIVLDYRIAQEGHNRCLQDKENERVGVIHAADSVIATSEAVKQRAFVNRNNAEAEIRRLRADIAKLDGSRRSFIERRAKAENTKKEAESTKGQKTTDITGLNLVKENAIKTIENTDAWLKKLENDITKSALNKMRAEEKSKEAGDIIEMTKVDLEKAKEDLKNAEIILSKLRGNDREGGNDKGVEV